LVPRGAEDCCKVPRGVTWRALYTWVFRGGVLVEGQVPNLLALLLQRWASSM
jgi:hypothetical protein